MFAILVAALSAATPAQEARLLTDIVAAAAAEDRRADVLTTADLRGALEVEAQRQLAGCDAKSSCLAEIAAALDAAVVVSGSVGDLDQERVLHLSAFDARSTSSAGRTSARATTTTALADGAEAAARRLIRPLLSATPPGQRLRILVLDVDTGVADDDAGAGVPVVAVVGGVVSATGVAGLVGAGAAAVVASSAAAIADDSTQNVAVARTAASDAGTWSTVALVTAAASAVAVVGGVVLVVVDLQEGAE